MKINNSYSLIVLLFSICLPVYSNALIGECKKGYELVKSDQYKEAIKPLTHCIDSDDTPDSVRSVMYKARAWSHYSLENYKTAVIDHERGLAIDDQKIYGDLINYALYLRLSGDAEKSLVPLKQAEEIDEKNDRVDMMTQYHIGWSLHELYRDQEVIEALTKGMEDQKDHIAAYYLRGLSYERLDNKTKAIQDFQIAAKLYKKWPYRDAKYDAEKSSVILQMESAFVEKLKEYKIDYGG